MPLHAARVVLANHAAIARIGFPSIPVGTPDERANDQWLLSHALISAAQAASSGWWRYVDRSQSRTCFRGERAGRSCLSPLSHEIQDPVELYLKDPETFSRSFVDIKGVGVRHGAMPSTHPYRTGLLPLQKAVDDYVKSILVEKVLLHCGAPFSTVTALAVIDSGFHMSENGRDNSTACMLVREAHLRPPGSDLPMMGSLAQRYGLEAELILRSYGITSADSRLQITKQDNHYVCMLNNQIAHTDCSEELCRKLVADYQISLPFEADRINIQMTWDSNYSERSKFRLVDFGHYEGVSVFNRPLLSLVRDRPFGWGGVLQTDSPYFIQPADKRLVQTEQWDSRHQQVTSAENPEAAVSPIARDFVRWMADLRPSSSEAHTAALQRISETLHFTLK